MHLGPNLSFPFLFLVAALPVAATAAVSTPFTQNFDSLADGNDTTMKTGEYFGLRTATANATGTDPTVTAIYDNFSLAVPEPSVLSMGALAAFGLLRRRRA